MSNFSVLLVQWLPARTGDWLSTHGTRLLGILIAVLVAWLFVRQALQPAIRRAVLAASGPEPTSEREKRARTLSRVLVRLVMAGIVVVGAFLALAEVGYNLVPVVTGLGIGGVAIGLGAQSLVKDTINGLFILGENQFGYGDWVTLAGVSGVVEDVNLRRTVLRDVDGTVYTIPNSAIVVSGNHTRDYSGINLIVLVPNGAALDRALEVIAETGRTLAEDPELGADVIEPPRPVRIESSDEKGVTLRVLGKVKAGRQMSLSFEFRRRLTEALDAAGLGFPLPAPAPPAPPAQG